MNSNGDPGNSSAVSGVVLTEAEPDIRALYSPSLGKVGCVLIQAAYRGDRRACHIFDARDWFLAPVADMTWISAPAADWEAVAAMPLAERLRLPISAEASPRTLTEAVASVSGRPHPILPLQAP